MNQSKTLESQADAILHQHGAHEHVHGPNCNHGHDHHHHAGETFVRAAAKIGRNDLCPCGSGKKHKKCCLV